MDARRREQQSKEDELQGAKGDIGGQEKGRGGARGEDGVPYLLKEGCHLVRLLSGLMLGQLSSGCSWR